MEDVLDLYAEEPNPKRRPLVCFDESSLKRSSIRTGGLVARYYRYGIHAEMTRFQQFRRSLRLGFSVR
jgi:hypothetical protein